MDILDIDNNRLDDFFRNPSQESLNDALSIMFKFSDNFFFNLFLIKLINTLHHAIKNNDLFAYEEVISTIIKLDNSKVNHYVEGFLTDYIDDFCAWISEKRKQNKSLENCENLIFDKKRVIISISNIEKIINAFNKDIDWFVINCIYSKIYYSNIDNLFLGHDKINYQIIDSYIKNYKNKLNADYIMFCISVIGYNPTYINKIIYPDLKWNLKPFIEAFIGSYYNTNSIINYLGYFSKLNEYSTIQSRILKKLSSGRIFQMLNISYSLSKDLVLKELVRRKKDFDIIKFIKIYPEYKNYISLM